MIDKNELCEKIRSIYPDIGECGIAVQVEFDEVQKLWVVDLKKDGPTVIEIPPGVLGILDDAALRRQCRW